MSHTIHGASHRALRFMRSKPATLPVYWIYISRTNMDNVAWPSLRGLATDTDWSVNSCKDARAWLVEHKALEIVTGYIRPEWRGLDDAARALKLSLDRAEYYKPTGKLVIEDKVYPMLYFGSEEPLIVIPDDVSPRDTSKRKKRCITPCDIAPRDTELSTKVPELDSSKGLPAPEKGADGQPPPILTSVPRKANPMYDAVFEIWGYTAALNGLMAGMLTGKASRKGWKEFNLETPIEPEDLRKWAAWYRKTELRGDVNMNMVAEPVKVQSSITAWCINKPDATSPLNGLKIVTADDEVA